MWAGCCCQLIASNITALNTRVQMEQLFASNVADSTAIYVDAPLTLTRTVI